MLLRTVPASSVVGPVKPACSREHRSTLSLTWIPVITKPLGQQCIWTPPAVHTVPESNNVESSPSSESDSATDAVSSDAMQPANEAAMASATNPLTKCFLMNSSSTC